MEKQPKHGKEVLRLERIRKTYMMGSVKVNAINGIDLSIKYGERISIVGPSGSGKSTLLHLIGLLDVPTGGSILLEGREVTKMSEEQIAYYRGKKVGFIFQAFHLIPSLTAIENVMLPMVFYNVPKEKRHARAKPLLQKMGMGERLSHLPSELSGGERQRVAIARALANDPPMLLADEPTGNLDSKAGKEVLDIFSKLHKEGKTIVVITHDSNVSKLGERIIHLKDGKIERITSGSKRK